MEERQTLRQATKLWQEAYRYQMEGELDRAIERYHRSIEAHPTAEAHTFLGWTLSFQGRLEEATEECLRAIAIDPEFGNPQNDIGVYLMQQDKLDEAIPWFEKAKQAKRYEPRQFAFELMKGLPSAPLPEVNLPQVHEGELPRFVAFGLLGLFKPWDRLVQLVLLHQIDPDVVMWIAELGVDRDRPETLFGGFLQTALKAQGPPQEGMRLGCGMRLDGALVALDRAVQLALHLVAVGLLP